MIERLARNGSPALGALVLLFGSLSTACPPAPVKPGMPPEKAPTLEDGGDARPEVAPTEAGVATDAGAPESTASPESTEPDDKCLPVGVAYEKQVRPLLKACYRDGKKREPNLEGTVKLAIEIDTLGKVKGHRIVEQTLPDAVANCMLKAVKATPVADSKKCPGKVFTIPITFPTPAR